MKNISLCIAVFLLLAISASAFNFVPERVGAHAALPLGGNIDDGTGGIGLRSEFALNRGFLLELDATWSRETSTRGFTITEVEQDLFGLGASIMFRRQAGEDVDLYCLGGLGYYMASATADSPDIDIEMDGALGYHVGVGAVSSLPYVSKNWELYVEYRYTLLELEGTWTLPGSILSETRSNDFGLFKLGVNRAF